MLKEKDLTLVPSHDLTTWSLQTHKNGAKTKM